VQHAFQFPALQPAAASRGSGALRANPPKRAKYK
jgi:hypothetical protein